VRYAGYDLLGFERVPFPLRLEGQGVGARHAVEEDDPVEMVVLVLDDPRVEAVSGQ
jgi:hypothetical protein